MSSIFIFTGLAIYGNGDSRILPWCPFVLGPLAGLFYMLARNTMIKLRLPDEAETVAIHLVPGNYEVFTKQNFPDLIARKICKKLQIIYKILKKLLS